jgi:putative addiction module component (TIGR02574 family)
MTPAATDEQTVLALARTLPADARERIAQELLDDLEPAGSPYTSEKVRLAWKEEIARRIAAYMNGEVKAIPAEEAFAQLDAELAEVERHAG